MTHLHEFECDLPAHLHNGDIRKLAGHMYRSLLVSIVHKAAHISCALNQPSLGKHLLQPPHTRLAVGELSAGSMFDHFRWRLSFSELLNEVEVVRLPPSSQSTMFATSLILNLRRAYENRTQSWEENVDVRRTKYARPYQVLLGFFW